MNLKALIAVACLCLPISAIADGARSIAKLTPEDGATSVPLDTTEISIEFDKPMAPTSSLMTKCDFGASCLANGIWKTKTLFVVQNVKLSPGQKYVLGIGDADTGMQRFGAEGVAMRITNWTFTAASQ